MTTLTLRALEQIRRRSERPEEIVLVSLVGPLRDLAQRIADTVGPAHHDARLNDGVIDPPVIVLPDHALTDIDFRPLGGLDVVVAHTGKPQAWKTVRVVDAIARCIPAQLETWNVVTGCCLHVASAGHTNFQEVPGWWL